MAIVTDQLSMILGQGKSSTLFQNGTDKKNFPDIMTVQATMNEVSTYSAEVTDNPVEEGFDITDHVRVKPPEYQIDGIITPFPLNAGEIAGLATAGAVGLNKIVGGFKGGIGAAAIAVAGGQVGSRLGGAFFSQTIKDDKGNSKQVDPLTATRSILEGILMNRQLIRIVSKYRTFDDMVMTSLSFNRDSSMGQMLKFSARLRQIQVVTSQTTILANVKSDAAHSAGTKEKEGKKTPEDATKRASVLLKGVRALSGLFGG